MECEESINLNPWFTMWTLPRATIRQIIDTDPRKKILLLASIVGIINVFEVVLDGVGSPDFSGAIVFLILGSLSGITSLYLISALHRLTGSWIGGQASTFELRAAIAWSNVPLIWSTLLWIPELIHRELFYWQDVFTSDLFVLFMDLVSFAKIFISIWTLIIFIVSLAEAQKFSIWKAILNVILTIVFVFVLIFIFASIF